ncbi:MAG: TonB-dependent receptor plug domain-containing protein [Parvularculaceae bacterium]|nr:TonB-dependent receptor plug domain-containing protein [Parvularculaceae bacterium]
MRSMLRRHLLATTVLISGASAASPVFAQDAAGPSDESQIVVTGTRVARPDLTANSPVSVLGEDVITNRNVVTADQLLNESPQFTPTITASTNNGNPGAATIDLRNLGSQRTLVLVDGKRMAAYDVSGSVDLNTIPTQLVQRIEVLTGGASAVYGSDAVAGVVNFILKKDFQGLQADGSWSQTQKGDGTEWNVSLTAGTNFAGGRGNITVSGSYLNREAVTQDRRDFSRVNLDSLDFTPSGSSNAVPTVIDNSFQSTGPDQYQFVPAGNTVVPFYQPYNFNPVNLLQVPQKRYSGTVLARYEVTPDVEFFARGTYVKTKVTTILAPTATFGFPFDINPTNPFVSAQLNSLIFGGDLAVINGDGTTTIGIRRRMVELGGRQTNFDNDLWQVVGGLRGSLGDSWKWEVFAQNASVVRNQLLLNDISYSRVQQALLVVPSGTGPRCTVTTNGCVPLNLFTSTPIAPNALAFITRDAQQRDKNSQFVAGGSINGSPEFLMSPWASKSGGVALGFEYRREKGQSDVDANYASGDLIGYGQGIPVAASSYNVKEFYAEWLQPIIQDRPFFHDLSIESGYRYSKYSSGIAGYTVGGVHTFKAGGSWSPVPNTR